MPTLYTNYNVFGLFGIFLMDFEKRKKLMGTKAKREKLIKASGIQFSDSFISQLADAGFAPVQPYNCRRLPPLLACWCCETAVTDWCEADTPEEVHRLLSPRCPSLHDTRSKCFIF